MTRQNLTPLEGLGMLALVIKMQVPLIDKYFIHYFEV
jgi:hypothetical protein